MKKTPVVDIGICTRCKGCLEVSPLVFRYNSMLDMVEVADLETYPENEVEEAIKLCPVDCISWDYHE